MARFTHIDSCGVCGETKSSFHLKDGEFTVNRCSNCGTYWVTPRLHSEDLNEVYQEQYWNSDSPQSMGYDSYFDKVHLYEKSFQRKESSFKSHLAKMNPTKRILDIGCSNGVFLRVMEKRGWKGVGVDISKSAIEQAVHHNKGTNLEFRCGYLHEVTSPDEKFDLVTMWDVIEHVEDPMKLLRDINQLLDKNGYLVLETQNMHSMFARMLKRKWHHYKHHEHIYHFNRKALKYMLNNTGFEIGKMSTLHAGKFVEFGFIAERSQRVSSRLARMLAKFRFLRDKALYVNPHDEFIVVARKKDQ